VAETKAEAEGRRECGEWRHAELTRGGLGIFGCGIGKSPPDDQLCHCLRASTASFSASPPSPQLKFPPPGRLAARPHPPAQFPIHPQFSQLLPLPPPPPLPPLSNPIPRRSPTPSISASPVTPPHPMPCHPIPYHPMSYHVMSPHVTSPHATPRHTPIAASSYPSPCRLSPVQSYPAGLPAPCTLHPAPCTRHPAPCTRHPAGPPDTRRPAPGWAQGARRTAHMACDPWLMAHAP
jgi:hypothetical protein